MAKADFAEMTVVEGRKAAAEHLGVSERTLYRWEKGGMPLLPDGRYDLMQITLWREKGDKKAGGRGRVSKDPEAERLSRVKADLAELTLQERRGEMISVSELEALLTPRAMIYRQGLVAFEQTLSYRLATALSLPAESLRVMTAVIRQAVQEVLAKVLRPLTLKGGQTLEWEKGASGESETSEPKDFSQSGD